MVHKSKRDFEFESWPLLVYVELDWSYYYCPVISAAVWNCKELQVSVHGNFRSHLSAFYQLEFDFVAFISNPKATLEQFPRDI